MFDGMAETLGLGGKGMLTGDTRMKQQIAGYKRSVVYRPDGLDAQARTKLRNGPEVYLLLSNQFNGTFSSSLETPGEISVTGVAEFRSLEARMI
jgi:hypothetical protein